MRHVGRVLRHLVIGLLDEFFNITVIADGEADLSALPSPPVDLLVCPHPRLGLLWRRSIQDMAAQLEEKNIELLHSFDASTYELTRRLCQIGDWPCLVSVLDAKPHPTLAPLDEHCRAVLAGSVPIRGRLLSRMGIAPEHVQLMRPGVHQLRKVSCFTQPDQSTAIIAAGSLDSYEPFAAVLEAFSALQKENYDCAGFIIGSGKYEHRLRQRAEQLGLMHQVTFVELPPQSQLPDIFKSADLFIYPQSSLRLEMEVLEAMAAGVPVLVGGPCAGDFVIDGETAASYDAASSADLTGKLKGMLDDHNVAIQLASSALGYLKEHHSPARMVMALAELYRQYAITGRTLRIQ